MTVGGFGLVGAGWKGVGLWKEWKLLFIQVMESQEKKSNGCLQNIVIILLIGGLFKIFGFGDESEISSKTTSTIVDSSEIKVMNAMKDSINYLLSGTYEGALYSDTYIPAADVRPGYINYNIKIFNVKVEAIDRGFSTSKVDSPGEVHFKGDVTVVGVDPEGYTSNFNGIILFYPNSNKICFLDNSSRSLLGKDPCKFYLYNGNIVSDDGPLIKNKKK